MTSAPLPARARLRRWLGELPVVLRSVLISSALLGAVGATAGLVIGLQTYAPTAGFAALELGVPAGILGSVLGLVVGLTLRWVAGSPVDDDFPAGPPAC